VGIPEKIFKVMGSEFNFKVMQQRPWKSCKTRCIMNPLKGLEPINIYLL